MPTRNRLALQRILGDNPTSNCGPQNQQRARILRQAQGQRATQTNDRYGNFLQFVANALQDVAHLPYNDIQRAVSQLADWLGKDDPLGLLHDLENGQLLTLLGEIAPVVAQWFSDNLGLTARGGRQSRRGGRATVRSLTVPSLASLINLGQTIAPFIQQYAGSLTIGGYPGASPQPGGGGPGPAGNPIGPSSTIELPQDMPNVLEIPSQDNG